MYTGMCKLFNLHFYLEMLFLSMGYDPLLMFMYDFLNPLGFVTVVSAENCIVFFVWFTISLKALRSV